ncbi:MAG: hypothetical protein E5299_01335 [Burkholderia gladioli]|nr:MAG: hypothetical protein E5299_01335 [Burkholderia gladioli]
MASILEGDDSSTNLFNVFEQMLVDSLLPHSLVEMALLHIYPQFVILKCESLPHVRGIHKKNNT